MKIDAQGVYYRDLNAKIRAAVAAGADKIDLVNVNGQYFIGDGINRPVTITISGVPGNDLGAFMNGATIVVKDNGQDNIGNTMNAGRVIVHGHAGDVLGYGMRGGRIHILKDVGYRVGIHMKSYDENKPVLIAGGKAGDFFGEYMAGGVLILLGMFTDDPHKAKHGFRFGTGMHGGVIYVRGQVDEAKLSQEVGVFELSKEDRKELEGYLKDYCKDFKLDLKEVLKEKFVKVLPKSKRPYGNMYCPMPR
ncbi:MAG: glutamate synthase subunit [Geobacteraceae bacterium]|nr:MAG: glutamate synthase subunit [Geobacteraceae bacterium]